MRQTLTASKVTQINSGEPSLNFKEVFYLATLGGAQCMGLDRTIGNFVKGKQFDAVIVDMNGIDLFEHDQILSTLQKFVYLGEGRNVKSVFVAGKRIF
jgi:guanine deaminase